MEAWEKWYHGQWGKLPYRWDPWKKMILAAAKAKKTPAPKWASDGWKKGKQTATAATRKTACPNMLKHGNCRDYDNGKDCPYCHHPMSIAKAKKAAAAPADSGWTDNSWNDNWWNDSSWNESGEWSEWTGGDAAQGQ